MSRACDAVGCLQRILFFGTLMSDFGHSEIGAFRKFWKIVSREARILVGAKRRPPKSSKIRFLAARRRRAAENFDYLGELIPPLQLIPSSEPPSPEGPEGEGGGINCWNSPDSNGAEAGWWRKPVPTEFHPVMNAYPHSTCSWSCEPQIGGLLFPGKPHSAQASLRGGAR